MCRNACRFTRTKSNPRLVDFIEVPPLEAPLAAVGPIGIVAKNVDAAAKRLVVASVHDAQRRGATRTAMRLQR